MEIKRSARQIQILNESVQIIHTKGIQGLTIKNIALATEVTEAAIYRHFKSKDEILSVILDVFQLNLNNMLQLIIVSDLPALEKLETVLNQIIDRFCANPAIVSVIFSDEIFVNKEDLHNKIIQIIQQNNECFFAIAVEGQKSNEIRNDITAEELAIIIMGSFRMVVKNWQLSNQSYSLKNRGKDFFKSLFKLISTQNN